MKRVYESINKIRRLVGDKQEDLFTDAKIVSAVKRAQVDFCEATLMLKDIIMVKAPQEIDYGYTNVWEENYIDGDGLQFTFETSEDTATHKWELEAGFAGNVSGDYTGSSGVEISHKGLQNEIPYFLPDSVYKIDALFWDYKELDYMSYNKIRNEYIDGWYKRGSVVDYYCMLPAYRKKAFLVRSNPYDEQDDGENKQSMVGEALLSDSFLVFVSKVPDRVVDHKTYARSNDSSDIDYNSWNPFYEDGDYFNAYSWEADDDYDGDDEKSVATNAFATALDVADPWVKYIEYWAASTLIGYDTARYSSFRIKHYKARADMGVALAKKMIRMGYEQRVRRFGSAIASRGGRPPRPSLPDRYPRLEA